MSQPPVEVAIEITAPPETVWTLVADLPRMGEWSPECTGVTWKGGATAARPGARFSGHNRRGIRRWSTQGRIVTAAPGSELSWETRALGLPGGLWGYRIEPTDGGSRVTEFWEDRRGGLLKTLGPVATGVTDRAAHNRAGMQTTLERLKAAAERVAGGG